jgi:phosphoribosylformylglycinamidine synthase I
MPDSSEIRVGVIRIEGTNCEDESAAAFSSLGCEVEKVHLKQLLGDVEKSNCRNLMDYDALYFPGGFSSGDYIRAGAIFASRVKSGLKSQVDEYINEGRPVLGVCNGFQILVEMGALPGIDSGTTEAPNAVLHTNDSNRFEARHVHLRVESKSQSFFTKNYDTNQVLSVPNAHAEGKLMMDQSQFEELEKNNQIAFRYCDKEGQLNPGYPWNPNGVAHDIAGITNPKGNVLGMMPHPERVFHGWQHTDWTSSGMNPEGPGHGRPLFEGVVDFLCQ